MPANLFTSNSKYRLIISSLLLIFITMFFDYSVGNILRFLYFRVKGGPYYRTTYSIEKATEEIIILGSSRANRHYDPDIITKCTGLSCYNTGRDGMELLYMEAILKAITVRYNPKVILIDLTAIMICKNDIINDLDRLSVLLPYYKDHREIRSIIHQRSKFEKAKLLSKIYPYNSTILTAMKNNVVKVIDHSGYVPLYSVMGDKEFRLLTAEPEIPLPEKNKPKFSDRKINTLNRIIKAAKDRNIHVFLVISPFFKTPEISQEINKYREISESNQVELLDFSKDDIFSFKRNLFKDNNHLNNNGAELFSRVLSEKIIMETWYSRSRLDHN